jgi:sialate O-acetylesterase
MVSLLLLAAGAAAPTAAEVKLHPLFTDRMVLQRDAEVPVIGTAGPGQRVTVSLSGDPVTVVEATADAGGQFVATLPKRAAGTGLTLTVKANDAGVSLADVAVGDVWVCSGQSNMQWSINAAWDADKYKGQPANPNLRLFTVGMKASDKPLTAAADLGHLGQSVRGKGDAPRGWTVAGANPQVLGEFSAVGFHFGSAVQKDIKVPVGLINTSWGGTPAEAWTSREALEAVKELAYYTKRKVDEARKQGGAGYLYNAMIHPLLKFPITGAIWYQGEANAGRAAEYRTLFPAMISDWRTKWGREFPFYAVQLAPFGSGDADGVTYAELRDAQRHATTVLPKVGMAVITDVGDLTDIHPKDKLTVGTRLARQALVGTYGRKGPPGGPVFKEAKFADGKAICSFTDIGGGLASKFGNNNPTVNGFELAGSDNQFRPAKARIVGETVVVTSDLVPDPKAVRFGWRNFPVVNLFNKEGLPASPFRSDDLPLTTAGKK